ncbi:putative SET domain containing protein [Neospora caninum Liverpool]|uniref:Putative SET domain containing protein n=1 Tax=Neospora caninum (strain Liverpool) TaxID=572307 RepID=F0VPX7_NEOCL|nr:putative SET domain containing protein [Neospora caninum Liverpool]CBZ55774.1 putative SET domain containing protein [Neospora caninum Liverpool]CEL70518.1 TPA: SET domain containing protein, putative [Neospora caninum Liverpool]|eukprot:XP_003885800.1 putative SET domain containing protein [Neospora caninum Liverpool]
MDSSQLTASPCWTGQGNSRHQFLAPSKATKDQALQTPAQNNVQGQNASPGTSSFIHPLLLPLLPSRFVFKNPSWPPTPKKKRNLAGGAAVPPPSAGARGSATGTSSASNGSTELSHLGLRTKPLSHDNPGTQNGADSPASPGDSAHASRPFPTSATGRKRRKIMTSQKPLSNGPAAQSDPPATGSVDDAQTCPAAFGENNQKDMCREGRAPPFSESAMCGILLASSLSTQAPSPSHLCENDSPRLALRTVTGGDTSSAEKMPELGCEVVDAAVAAGSPSSACGDKALEEVTRTERDSLARRLSGDQQPHHASSDSSRDCSTHLGPLHADGERPEQPSSARAPLTQSRGAAPAGDRTECSPVRGFLGTSPAAAEVPALLLSAVYAGEQTPSKTVEAQSCGTKEKDTSRVGTLEKSCGADATYAARRVTQQLAAGRGRRWGEAPSSANQAATPSRQASETPARMLSSQSSRTPSKGPFLPSIACGLVVSASSLGRGSGLGVYATRAYSARSRIGEYAGVCVDRKVAMMLRGMGTSTHVMRVGMQYQYLVGYRLPFVFGGAGAFVNDGRWYADGRKGPGVTARFHVAYDKKRAKDRVYVVATRDIAEGEEIFTSYDNQYWALLH